jgi:hypothetical protein
MWYMFLTNALESFQNPVICYRILYVSLCWSVYIPVGFEA